MNEHPNEGTSDETAAFWQQNGAWHNTAFHPKQSKIPGQECANIAVWLGFDTRTRRLCLVKMSFFG